MQTHGTAQLDALGDGTRRTIVERLRNGPLPVGQIAKGLSVSRPAVSQHLRVLEGAGLVSHREDGTRRVYRLELAGLEELRAYLDSYWTDALVAFKAAAERSTR